ncbi:uncharacterized protein EDB91DRAFT_1083646 [Suillus paluster]|uniref:uncharacterized protein n=1 Tax=Suillus paluster TaxID=48578 RepID=UPI001B884521|nr:uncharacterized protein EDB91DRAFT_1083646 [Suillus paluster]KAG1735746.1 hypothetical protein EDB91DRAFT_1083646 [Suillus paluster]
MYNNPEGSKKSTKQNLEERQVEMAAEFTHLQEAIHLEEEEEGKQREEENKNKNKNKNKVEEKQRRVAAEWKHEEEQKQKNIAVWDADRHRYGTSLLHRSSAIYI